MEGVDRAGCKSTQVINNPELVGPTKYKRICVMLGYNNNLTYLTTKEFSDFNTFYLSDHSKLGDIGTITMVCCLDLIC